MIWEKGLTRPRADRNCSQVKEERFKNSALRLAFGVQNSGFRKAAGIACALMKILRIEDEYPFL
jgi:hypothetical protein